MRARQIAPEVEKELQEVTLQAVEDNAIVMFDTVFPMDRTTIKEPIRGCTSGRNDLGQLNGTMTIDDLNLMLDLARIYNWGRFDYPFPERLNVLIYDAKNPSRAVIAKGIKAGTASTNPNVTRLSTKLHAELAGCANFLSTDEAAKR